MEFTDTHCHLNLNKFEHDLPEVLDRALKTGVSHILIPGLNLEPGHESWELANCDPMLFAAIGVHPSDSIGWRSFSQSEMMKLLGVNSPDKEQQKIVAIGEIGLDYYWQNAPHAHQKQVLLEQLDIAAETSLPVILHMREKNDMEIGECADDFLDIITNWTGKLRKDGNPLAKSPGVFHSFSGSLEMAEKLVAMGFFIGVTGPVTYPKNGSRQEMVANIQLENLLIETDAPFLAPQSHRGRRNEPFMVKFIAQKIAELHLVDLETVAEQTTRNARKLFNW